MVDHKWRTCADGNFCEEHRNFCEEHRNTCCYHCPNGYYCELVCEKVDYNLRPADACMAYKKKYGDSDNLST